MSNERTLDQSTAAERKQAIARLVTQGKMTYEKPGQYIADSVDKKSREQFELKTHKRLIDITDSRAQTVDALTKLDLPSGVDVEIKVQ